MIIYLSGPYTGDGEEETKQGNVNRMIWLADDLMDYGFTVINPLLSHYHNKQFERNYDSWMRQDLEILEKADVLLRIPGDSKGADIEVDEAYRLAIPVVFLENDVFGLPKK